MLALALCLALAQPRDSIADRLQRDLAPWLAERAAAGAFSGVVLVTRDGRPIFTAAYGQADRERGVPNTLGTRFNLGSMNKMWTAVAVAQLVEQRRVDLDAPIGRYLPELPNAPLRDRVLVRHLLSHSSGLGTYFQNGFLRNRTYAERVSDYLPYFVRDSLAFAPGERMQYSNAGFVLLGLLVERVSGQPYWDYVTEHVLRRAGMTGAAFVDTRPRPRDVAVGYAAPQGGAPNGPNAGGAPSGPGVPNWDVIEPRSSPAGGAYASAGDVVAFSRALWGGRLVGDALVRELTTGKVAMGPQMQYAYGFGTGAIGGWRWVGHNGGIPGANAEFMSFPDRGIDLVVLANVDAPAASAVALRAAGILTGAGALRLRTAP